MGVNRTEFLKTALGATAGLSVAATASPWRSEAEAAAMTSGPEVFVGFLCPSTGSYSADGEDERKGYGEVRTCALGQVGTDVLLVVYTMRGERCRIISARLGNRKERQRWLSRG